MGTYSAKVDAKSRMSVPKSHRDEVEKSGGVEVVVTHWQDQGHPCMDVLPVPVWDAFLLRFNELPQMDPQVEVFRNFYVTPAQRLSIDSAGRLLLPQHHREYAKLEHDVVVVGAHDRFRVWNADLWRQVFDRSAEQFAAAKAALAERLR